MAFPALPSHSPEDRPVDQQARAWILELADDPSAEERCREWRSASPTNDAAFREVENVWALSAELGSVMDAGWREEAAALSAPRLARLGSWALRGPGRTILPLAMAASIAAVIVAPQLLTPSSLELETGIAETRAVRLADGSMVTLGARSAVEVQFGGGAREVVLEEGQAFFEVAHDAARPFTVVAGKAEIRVTGTRFDVRRIGDDVEVSVLDGRVELRKRPLLPLARQESPSRVLTGGEKSALEDGRSFGPEQVAAVTPGEWRSGRLFYAEARLSDIVADVQRYSRVPIRLEGTEAGAMKVTTSFRANEIDQFLDNLDATLPVESGRLADGTITIRAK